MGAAAKTEQYNVLAGELRTCRLTQFVRKIDVLEQARAQQEEKDAAFIGSDGKKRIFPFRYFALRLCSIRSSIQVTGQSTEIWGILWILKYHSIHHPQKEGYMK